MSDDWLYELAKAAKRLLPQAMWQAIRGLATASLTPIRFSVITGHWKSSFEQVALSARGEPLPWYTYPAIDFLSHRGFANKNILEFGGGQSTLWWSARSQTVLTVEDSREWYELLLAKIAPNVTLRYVPIDIVGRSTVEVRRVIDANLIKQFDVVIIDGHLRRELVPLAFEVLAVDGAIIFDDAEGYGFLDEIKDRDCRRVDFFGFAPGVSRRHCTSMVFSGDTFLIDPTIPIATIEGGTHLDMDSHHDGGGVLRRGA